MYCLRRHQTTNQIIFIFIIWISSHCDDIDKVLQVPFLLKNALPFAGTLPLSNFSWSTAISVLLIEKSHVIVQWVAH